MKNTKLGPFGLYLIWIGLCLVFGILIPVLSANSDSSAQVPFVLGTYIFIALICGIFLISILNMLLFKQLTRRLLYLNGVITVVTGGVIVYYLFKIFTL